MMKNRRAISDLVATVLLVLIVIAAVGIIWGAIMPIIRSNIETSQKCSAAELSINTQSGYTYATGSNVYVQVSRGASSAVTINAIQVKVIDSSGNSNITTFANGPSPNADQVYNISIPANTTIKKVGVAAIIALGNLNYTCSMTEYDMPK
jgi:flagellin-like protein